jgi:TFIIF, beta subunit HTH domain/TFIIF, beta subunit N-terminus
MDIDYDNYDEEVAGAAEQQRVTAASYGALDTSTASDECWMIRIPPKLAELWEKVPEGLELGELIFTKGGTKPDGTTIKPSLTVHVSEELADNHNNDQHQKQKRPVNPNTVPLHYSLQAMTKKIPVMHPFIRNSKTGSCQLLGTVSRTGNLQVYQQDSNYRAQLKDRLVATNFTGQRFVKPVDVTESILTKQRSATTSLMASAMSTGGSIGGKHSFGNAVFQYGKRLQDQSQDTSLSASSSGANGPSAKKKARQFAPDQPLRSVLFELFGQQPYWTIKELKSAAINGGCTAASAKRAEAEIREILRSEIGEYHRSGDFKNKWELRKEFQQQHQEE